MERFCHGSIVIILIYVYLQFYRGGFSLVLPMPMLSRRERAIFIQTFSFLAQCPRIRWLPTYADTEVGNLWFNFNRDQLPGVWRIIPILGVLSCPSSVLFLFLEVVLSTRHSIITALSSRVSRTVVIKFFANESSTFEALPRSLYNSVRASVLIDSSRVAKKEERPPTTYSTWLI